MNSIKYIFILVAPLIFFSCQEEYTNTEVDGKAGIIAIEGFVTNDSDTYVVRISKSNSFESSSNSINPYTKAVVWILAPKNKQYLLQEFEPGKYSSQIGQFVGVVGYKYMLKVILTDGVVIESDLCEILPPPTLDSLSGELSTKSVLVKDEAGNMEEKVSKIVKLLVDYTPAKDKDYYYNFETTIVEQSKHYEPLPTYKYGVFCIRTYRTTDGNILKSANKDYLFPVKKFEVGHLDEFDPTTSVDSMSGPAHSEGNVCIVKAFSITPEIFNLYSKIQSQVKPENTIFDPIPTQIESNLHVTSDKKIKVIGYFGAAGVAQRILFIDWKYPQDPLTQRTLNSYTKYYKDECLIRKVPSYWVY